MAHLTGEDIASWVKVCHTFREACDPQFWKFLTVRDFDLRSCLAKYVRNFELLTLHNILLLFAVQRIRGKIRIYLITAWTGGLRSCCRRKLFILDSLFAYPQQAASVCFRYFDYSHMCEGGKAEVMLRLVGRKYLFNLDGMCAMPAAFVAHSV